MALDEEFSRNRGISGLSGVFISERPGDASLRKFHRIGTTMVAISMLTAMPLAASATTSERGAATDRGAIAVEADSTVGRDERPARSGANEDTERREAPDRDLEETSDRCSRHSVDDPRRCLDRAPEPDRCHPRLVDNPRRCIDHGPPHDIDIRHLIWRLINAHEWEKLVRLLHHLGWL